MINAKQSLEAAIKLAASFDDYIDLSNAIFNPDDGLFVGTTREERKIFAKSEEYKEIRKLIEDKR